MRRTGSGTGSNSATREKGRVDWPLPVESRIEHRDGAGLFPVGCLPTCHQRARLDLLAPGLVGLDLLLDRREIVLLLDAECIEDDLPGLAVDGLD